MRTIPRLNGFIRALETGKPAFGAFVPPELDAAINFSSAKYDGIIFEMEHNPWDIRALRDSLQYMLNRRQIADSGSLAPPVTPIVRIPPNGAEKNHWLAKQALDVGAYGVVWPHIVTVEQAYNAVAACRYPRLENAALYHPAGVRGDAPMTAARYWGLTQEEYYKKADVWPLNPEGEILVILMIESVRAVANLADMLKNVAGIGAVLIGEGDMTQELGHPRKYDYPPLLEAMREVVATCTRFNVPVGHPHVDSQNVERVLNEGYRLLMAAPTRHYEALDKGRQLAKREQD